MKLAECSPVLWPWLELAVVAAASLASIGLISAIRPLLMQHALVHPNTRSAHTVATPQGGGLAVILAIIGVSSWAVLAGCHIRPATSVSFSFWVAMASAGLIALVGIADDIKAVPVVTRLLLQSAAVVALIYGLPSDLNVVWFLPAAVERLLLFAGGLWFVNLVNFMDGVDWMTVSAVIPISAALILFGHLGALPDVGTVTALALLGALLGFAPFNRPAARLFLGDAGSLPIALLLGWMLALLAHEGHLVAAILLPLYYVMDTTLTLLRRLWRREPVLAGHRMHYYQRAVAGGFSVLNVVTRVFWINSALVSLATISVLGNSVALDLPLLAVALTLVTLLLSDFARGRQ